MNGSLAIQKALVTALTSWGFKVYDSPPKTATYPFILIGDDRQGDLDVKNGDYLNVSSTILVFSVYNGKLQVKTILEQIRAICYDLVLEGFELVGVRVDDSFTLLDETNQVTQGVITVNFRLIKGD